ncbi:unnamed protein product, partial [marine sediment metagenome]
RNHPGYQEFMRGVIDYAVKEVKADLLHFDNFINETGWGPTAIEDFRGYLRAKYNPAELDQYFGGSDLKDVGRLAWEGYSPVIQEWQLFRHWSLAEAYRKLTEYARSLNPEVAINANTGGISMSGYPGMVDILLPVFRLIL